jgi:hypothetical protein
LWIMHDSMGVNDPQIVSIPNNFSTGLLINWV